MAEHEWKVLQIEDDPLVVNIKPNLRVDHYWRDCVFPIKTSTMEQKYPTLEKVIKTALIIPHGNSDVERGFSVNKDMIGDDRTLLTMPSKNGLRLCKEAVKQADGKPEKVPLTKEIINSAAHARSAYEKRLQEEREATEKKKAEEERKKQEKERLQKEKQQLLKENATLNEKVLTLEKQEEEYTKEFEVGKQLVDQGTNELDRGLNENDMNVISKARLMIQSGKDHMDKFQSKLKEVREAQKSVDAKKDKLLSTATSSKSFLSLFNQSSDKKSKHKVKSSAHSSSKQAKDVTPKQSKDSGEQEKKRKHDSKENGMPATKKARK